jgi:hypothetical protein
MNQPDDGTLTPAEAWRQLASRIYPDVYTGTVWIVVNTTTNHPWATFRDMDAAEDAAKALTEDTGHAYTTVPVDHYERREE